MSDQLTLSEIIAQLQALANAQNQFSQADLDNAVSAATGPLNTQIATLQAQIAAFTPGFSQAQLDDAVSGQRTLDKAAFKTLVSAEDADLNSKIDLL